jgi:hypothetical protein
MPTTQKDERFVRLPSDLYAKLVDIAEREDRSVAGSAQYRPRRDRAPDHRTVRPWGCAMSQIMTPDTDNPATDDAVMIDQMVDRLAKGQSLSLMMTSAAADDFIAMARGIAEEAKTATGDEWNVASIVDLNQRIVQVNFSPVARGAAR